MLGTIKLNTIKNKLNDFELKSCVYICPSDINDEIQSFSPYYYNINKSSFYILCSNKRSSTYFVHDYTLFNNNRINSTKNILLNVCDFEKNDLEIHDIKLERFLIIHKNKDFLGWHPADNLIDENINGLRGNRYCKHHKDNFYYGDNTYNIDLNKLYLFVRIMPKTCTNLTNLLINCTRNNIYNISERGDIDKVGTLGFIVKLDHRFEYSYSNVYNKVTKIRYPFLTRKRIDELLFDDYKTSYTIKKEILYIKDNSKLDKYGIKVLDDF